MEVKVTKIGSRWHARLLRDETVIDEMACEDKLDIGWICREMLRWQSKLGSDEQHAESARRRQTDKPVGKVWYLNRGSQ